jgi:hypothetical protein
LTGLAFRVAETGDADSADSVTERSGGNTVTADRGGLASVVDTALSGGAIGVGVTLDASVNIGADESGTAVSVLDTLDASVSGGLAGFADRTVGSSVTLDARMGSSVADSPWTASGIRVATKSAGTSITPLSGAALSVAGASTASVLVTERTRWAVRIDETLDADVVQAFAA